MSNITLFYNIFGNEKMIKIDSINENEKIIKHSDFLYEYKVDDSSQDSFNKLLNLLNEWNRFSNKNNICYWSTAGTLLGTIRHKGFIPWDNDIDICILLKDLNDIKRKLSSQNKINYIEVEIGLRLFIEEDKNHFIDVFVCDYFDKHTIKYAGFICDNNPSWYINELFPKEFFLENELFPLQEYSFENITIMVPKNPNNFLYRAYSESCLNSCIISSHTIMHKLIELNTHTLHILKAIHNMDKLMNISSDNSILKFLFGSVAKEFFKNNDSNVNINDVIFKIIYGFNKNNL